MVGDPVWSSVGDPLEFSGGRWWWEILGRGGAESNNGHLRRGVGVLWGSSGTHWGFADSVSRQ